MNTFRFARIGYWLMTLLIPLVMNCRNESPGYVKDTDTSRYPLPTFDSSKFALIAFLNVSSKLSLDERATSSAIMNHVRSLKTQHNDFWEEISLVIVDMSYKKTGVKTSKDELINFKYDLGLGNEIVVDSEPESVLEKKYNVDSAGVLLFVNSKGEVLFRSSALANPAHLSMKMDTIFTFKKPDGANK
jgi:hypothetical protein